MLGIHGYGVTKIKEIKHIMGLRGDDLTMRQNVSRPFLQAQNEIRQEILEKRNDLVAKTLFSEKDYAKYQKLSKPFLKNVDQPFGTDKWDLTKDITGATWAPRKLR